MGNRLDWGTLAEAPPVRRWPRVHKGRILFVIRNGAIEFPQGDRTVWPWDSVTTIGYLNVEPTQFQVDVAGLTSKDGVACLCTTQFEVQLKQEIEWRIMASSRQDGLYDSFRLITTQCVQRVFKTFEYKAILLGDQAIRDALGAQVADDIQSNTPYFVRRFVLDHVESTSADLDDSIRTVSAAEVGSAELARADELESELETTRRRRLRNAELADVDHEMEVKRKREEADRATRRRTKEDDLWLGKAETLQELELSKLTREQNRGLAKGEDADRLEFVGSLYKTLNGDIQFWMANEHPELWAKMQMSDAQSRREVAIALQQLMNAHAHDQGVTETLKGVMGQLHLGLNADRLEISGLTNAPPPSTDTTSTAKPLGE